MLLVCCIGILSLLLFERMILLVGFSFLWVVKWFWVICRIMVLGYCCSWWVFYWILVFLMVLCCWVCRWMCSMIRIFVCLVVMRCRSVVIGIYLGSICVIIVCFWFWCVVWECMFWSLFVIWINLVRLRCIICCVFFLGFFICCIFVFVCCGRFGVFWMCLLGDCGWCLRRMGVSLRVICLVLGKCVCICERCGRCRLRCVGLCMRRRSGRGCWWCWMEVWMGWLWVWIWVMVWVVWVMVIFMYF